MTEENPEKEKLRETLRGLQREVTLKEIAEILSATIKEDQPAKLITFLTTLLTYTDQDQQNLCFKGESAGGKSYNALEIAQYFPEKDVIKIAYSSPTAFFHDKGTWDPENKAVIVNLRQKILIFLDQPHDQLLQRLRPLLSHDNPELLYKITDKREKSGTRAKYIILEGYPTVIFCTAKMNVDEQDRILECLKIVAKRSGVTVDERESAIYEMRFAKASMMFWKNELQQAEEYFPKAKAATLEILIRYVEHHEKLL